MSSSAGGVLALLTGLVIGAASWLVSSTSRSSSNNDNKSSTTNANQQRQSSTSYTAVRNTLPATSPSSVHQNHPTSSSSQQRTCNNNNSHNNSIVSNNRTAAVATATATTSTRATAHTTAATSSRATSSSSSSSTSSSSHRLLGREFDTRDDFGKWMLARVIQVSNCIDGCEWLLMHFDGCDSEWDEWIHSKSYVQTVPSSAQLAASAMRPRLAPPGVFLPQGRSRLSHDLKKSDSIQVQVHIPLDKDETHHPRFAVKWLPAVVKSIEGYQIEVEWPAGGDRTSTFEYPIWFHVQLGEVRPAATQPKGAANRTAKKRNTTTSNSSSVPPPPVPPVDSPGEWVLRDQFTGNKSFGYYACKCGRKWRTAHSYKDNTQDCKGCETPCYPIYMWVNHGKRDVARVRDDSDKPHDQDRCGKCRELGSACWKY